MTRLVLACATSGLANRIKGLVTAQRVAAELGVGLRVYWEANAAVRAPLDSLFAHDLVEVGAEEAATLAADPGVLAIRTWRLWPSAQDPFPAGYRPSYPSPHRHGIDFAYHAIPHGVRAAILPWFARLRPLSAVSEAAQAVLAGRSGPLWGMAVRSWVDAPERRRLFDQAAVEVALAASAGPVFVTSDARGLVEGLCARFPAQAFSSLGHTGGLSGDQAALCDLLAVARCPRMWVSLGSTFSEVAWWMGGGLAEVAVIPPRRYGLNLVDLGEVAGYALGGRWWFKNKSALDARLAGVWRRMHG